MNNFYKLMFSIILFMSTMISISSYTWMGTWMGLEMNLLSFIPMMKTNNNSYSSESSMKYYMIQTLSSLMFLFSIMLNMMYNNLMNNMMINILLLLMINSSLLLKMGAAPFHFWFPEIIEGMNWINCMILMTWQKITPMMLLLYTLKYSNYIIMFIIMSSLISSLSGLNQTSLRKIMVYSSINHMSWMLSSLLNSNLIWMMYFIIYSFMSITLMYMMKLYKIFFLKQMFFFMNMDLLIKFSLMMNFLSLGGLPPLLGFFPKWMIIQSLSNNYLYLLFFMIMMTLITLYFYMRIMYSSFILFHYKLNMYIYNNKNYKNNKLMLFSSLMSSYSLIFLIILFYL